MPDKDRTSVECAWTSIYGLDGQDIISQIFSDEDLKRISDLKFEIDISDSDLEINEKCYFTFLSIPVVYTPDPLSVVVDMAKTVDFDKFRYTILNLAADNIVDYNVGNLQAIKYFYSNEKYYNMFCEAASLTDEEKKTLDTYKSQILNGEECDDEQILFVIKDERVKSLWIYVNAAVMEKLKCYPDALQLDNPDALLPLMRLSKAFVKLYKEKYDIWEGSVTEIFKQRWLLGASVHSEKPVDNIEARRKVHFFFITYYEAYSDNWKKTIFEDMLREQCNNPVNALKFANALKTQKYCREFCREYEDYIEEKGIRPLFNTSIVVPVIPDLETDKDESHKNWFVEVDRVKAKDGKKKSLYNALYSLYEWLKGEGYISEKTSVDLFIYRFSGYLAPKPLEHKISWNGNMNVLAFIFKCLYTRKDGGSIIKPPYKKLSEFFIPELSNGSQLAGSLDRKKQIDIIQKLELFGFKNVNPSEIQ